jgi:hypothetical protein
MSDAHHVSTKHPFLRQDVRDLHESPHGGTAPITPHGCAHATLRATSTGFAKATLASGWGRVKTSSTGAAGVRRRSLCSRVCMMLIRGWVACTSIGVVPPIKSWQSRRGLG